MHANTAEDPNSPAVSACGRSAWLAAAAAATVVASLVFWLFPGLDISTSRALYGPDGFVGERVAGLVYLLRLGRASGWLVGAVFLTVLAVKIRWPERLSSALWRRWWVSLVALALGPGLLVNGLLKAYMGRPRPIQVNQFGGTADYVPVWTHSTACQANCSFVSGEASFGLFLIVFAFWFAGAMRWPALALIGLFGVAMSLNRVAFGAHFLSDVVLGWCLTALVILLVDRYLPRRLAEL